MTGTRRGQSGGTGGQKLVIVGAIVFIVLLVTALCFVIVLRPAENEYNNTIPAFMGILGIVTSAVSGLVVLLNQDQKHKENKDTIANVNATLEENKSKIDEVTHVVSDAIQHVQDLPTVALAKDSPASEGGNA
jgi:hypothetical protein